LLSEVNANPWQKAILLVQMAVLRPKQKPRAALLEDAAGCLLLGERGERELHASAPPSQPQPGAPPPALGTDMSSVSVGSGGLGKRTLVPGAPAVLTRTSKAVTLVVTPSSVRLKSLVQDKPPPIPVAFMVLAKTYGTGLAPGMHNKAWGY
jgi:hypothetical protein